MDEPSPGTLSLAVGKILTYLFDTHADILASVPSTKARALTSLRTERSPTRQQDRSPAESIASVRRLSPGNFRRYNARPVSCYALFKGWLLLSQPPGCFRVITSLTTERRLGDLS